MLRLTLLITLLCLCGGAYYVWSSIPDVAPLKDHFAKVTYHGPKEPFEVSLQKARPPGYVGLGQVSRVAVGAVVVSEDWAFYQHKGYDPNQIREAAREAWEAGAPVRGASTITQQVAKNVFLSQERTLARKLKELWLATRLEETVGKKKILETYLNVAEWGPGVFGIGAAARHYFKKAASELTAKEGAFLAMLLPSPKRYSQSFRKKRLTEYAQRTVDDILFKMQQAGYLSEDQRMLEATAPLPFEQMPDQHLLDAAAPASAPSTGNGSGWDGEQLPEPPAESH